MADIIKPVDAASGVATIAPKSAENSKSESSSFLEFSNIFKSFDGKKILDNVSLNIQKGEIFSLLGPSGCGKTTLLRICGGFVQPDKGKVLLNGVNITNLPPHHRKVNTVFQSYALFPHLTVWENIAFGLRIAKKPEEEIIEQVEEHLKLTQMTSHAHKKPSELSGGQKQRVAIARALINKPQVLLLDEPLAALDLKLRQRMLVELDKIHDKVGITFIFVTHDQGEAMSISDHIAILNDGRVEQIGKPAEIYEAPKTSFVAAFIGDTNFFDGVVSENSEREYIRMNVEGFPDILAYNDKPERIDKLDRLKIGDKINISVRPEKINISIEEPPKTEKNHRNVMRGKVEDVIYLGATTKFWVRIGEYRIAVSKQHKRFSLDEKPILWDDDVWLYWQADDSYMLDRYQEEDEQLLSLPSE